MQVGKVDILNDEIEATNVLIERKRAVVLARLERLLDTMETIGANDMGRLCHQDASRYHAATSRIRLVVKSLKGK